MPDILMSMARDGEYFAWRERGRADVVFEFVC